MAREVHTVLTQIIAEGRGITEAKAEEVVKNMRSANQYQVRLYQAPKGLACCSIPTAFANPSTGGRLVVNSSFRCECLILEHGAANASRDLRVTWLLDWCSAFSALPFREHGYTAAPIEQQDWGGGERIQDQRSIIGGVTLMTDPVTFLDRKHFLISSAVNRFLFSKSSRR